MERESAEQSKRLIYFALALTVIIAVSIGLSLNYFQTRNKQTAKVATCTGIPAISYMYCPSALRISAEGEPGAFPTYCPLPCASWNFTVEIGSNTVRQGQEILLMANLTNLGPNLTNFSWTDPFINVIVYDSNGTIVWTWYQSDISYENLTISSGDSFSQNVSVPTSLLTIGQSYSIEVAPLSIQFPTPNNYTFTFQFFVT